MKGLSVERLDEGSFQLWDGFVAGAPHGTLFHSTAWLRRIRDEVQVLVVRDGEGSILVGAALVRTSRLGLSGFHIPTSTPRFGPLVGALPSTTPAGRLSDYVHLLGLLLDGLPRCGHYDFKLPPEETNVLPYLWRGYEASVAYTHVVTGTLDSFRAGLHRKQRSELGKLLEREQAGDVVVGHSPDLDRFLPLLEATAERGGFRFQSDTIRALFPLDGYDRWWRLYFVGPAGGDPVLGQVVVWDDRTVFNLLGGMTRRGPTNLKYANLLMVDRAAALAFSASRRLDLVGSLLPGVAEFYRLLGLEPVPQYRVQRTPSLPHFLARAAGAYRRQWR